MPTPNTTPWFTWNGTDLTQFGSPVTGSRVASFTTSVVGYRNLNWIKIESTPIPPFVPAGFIAPTEGAVILPILATPPSANYIIEAEMLNIDNQNAVANMIIARYGGLAVGYWFHHSPVYASWVLRRADQSTIPGNTHLQLIDDNNNGNAQPRPGQLCRLGVEGSSIVFVDAVECSSFVDTSSPPTSAGMAAIGCSCGGESGASSSGSNGTTIVALFRNIKCYNLQQVTPSIAQSIFQSGLTATVIAHDLIRLNFPAPMSITPAFKTPASYSITSIVSGTNDVIIKEVIVDERYQDTASFIDLFITNPTLESRYLITVVGDVRQASNGNPLSTEDIEAEFLGHLTKTDSLLSTIQRIYDISIHSTLRQVMTAIGIQDEVAGGKGDLPARGVIGGPGKWGATKWGDEPWGG